MNFQIAKGVLLTVVAAFAASGGEACTAVLVGKGASATGRVLVGHNEDGSGARIRHAFVPATDEGFGFYWSEVKQEKGDVKPGDLMLNEKGVLVLSNNGGFQSAWCGKSGRLPDEPGFSDLTDGGAGHDLRLTIARKAQTAREGVALATNLITRLGYRHDSRIFTVADKDEAWVVEVIRGRRFVARRCPDDEVVVHPNCLSIREIRPDDIVSENIAAKGADFDFTSAYQGPRDWSSPYNLYRWKCLYQITCDVELDGTAYPFSVKPRQPVTVESIKAGLSSHYEGTPHAVKPHPANRDEKSETVCAPICRETTQESIVCAFGETPAATVLHSATGRPCETPYGCYRPLDGLLPLDVSRGEMALKRLRERALPLPPPAKVAVFAGKGPRSNGAYEYSRLVASSPDLELTLVDAKMVRAGALEGQDLLIMPGGVSRDEKADLGPEGAARIKDFLRAGGNYLGSCAGCCFLMDAEMDPDRGIGVIPYHRTGSKGGFMMPVDVNEKGAKALGIDAGKYTIRYHGGPVLEPSTNVIADASFEIWGMYAADFGRPGSRPEMLGRGAMVGGTYGKGRVFAFTVHPENFIGTRELVRGAFRYVLGRDVAFPGRSRAMGALSVGWYTQGGATVGAVGAMLKAQALEGVDIFPIAGDEVNQNMLDHVDVLVLPCGNAKYYEKCLATQRTLLADYAARGGKIIGWGAGAAAGVDGTVAFSSAEEVLAELARLASSRPTASPKPVDSEWSGLFPADVKTVGVPAPASITERKKLLARLEKLRAAGYRVKVGRFVDVKAQASAADRAQDLMDLWMDPEVDLILCARGGKGCEDVLPLLDWDRLKTRDMRVLGFSNITHLLNAMLVKGAGHPYSSTLLSSLSYQVPETRAYLRTVLEGADLPTRKLTVKRPGAFAGLPIGGHVVVFAKYMEGDFAVDPTDKVIFLECGGSERPATAVADALKRLTDRGVFAKCAGVVLADFTGCGTKAELKAVFDDWLKTVTCPVVSGYHYGHVPLSHAIDFRRGARVSADGILSWSGVK